MSKVLSVELRHPFKGGPTQLKQPFFEPGPDCEVELDYERRLMRIRHKSKSGKVFVVTFEGMRWIEADTPAEAKPKAARK